MAELLGVIASGITVAQIAGEIIGTCLKIKRLINDYDEMPARLEDLLHQVEILAPIISEISTNYDTLSLQAAPNGTLRNAVSYCQMALDQLASLARSLSSQIEASRGIKRKVNLVKALLRGDQVTQCERSLQTALQLLSLAQQGYIFALQRVQPEIIALQVLRHLEARGETLSHELGKCIPDSTPRNGVESRRKTRKLDSVLGREIRLGIPCITGTVEVYRPSSKSDIEASLKEKGQAALLQFKFRMPTWLCSMVIDSTMYRSYSGWTHCFKMYRTHAWDSTARRTALDMITKDDVDGLRRIFQTTAINPLDRFSGLTDLDREWCLLSFSVACEAWKAGSYLLQYEPKQSICVLSLRSPMIGQGDNCEHFIAFLKNDGLPDDVRWDIFTHYGRNLQDPSSVRRRIWPDDEYYSSDFRNRRLRTACNIAFWFPADPKFFGLVLSKSGHLNYDDVDFNWPKSGHAGIQHGIAHIIGHTSWIDSHTARDWHNSASEVLQLVERYENLCSIRQIIQIWRQPAYGSPFRCLFMASFWPRPTNVSRKCKLQARLNACDDALKVWLELVQKAGFDLKEYGIREKRQLASEDRGGPQDYCIFRDVSRYPHMNSRMKIRLISFTYGSEVDDWKLWWSEPTDELVGDFWRDIDPEPLYIPGSWIDDDA